MTLQLCACRRLSTSQVTCDLCLSDLHQLLTDMPWLDEQLIASLSRQHGASLTSGGASSGETPLPWNDQASRAQRRLHERLTTWARRCTLEHVAHQAPTNAPPRGDHPTITDLGTWLGWRVDGLAHHDFATAMLRDLTAASTTARSVVLFKPSSRVFLGRCEGTLPTENHPRSEPCDGEVYADEDAATGVCERCGRPYLTAGQRRKMEQELDDRLYPAAEIARMTTFLGLDMDREQVRKRINQWHARRRITPAGHDTRTTPPTPLFRYGEVRDLLYQHATQRAGA